MTGMQPAARRLIAGLLVALAVMACGSSTASPATGSETHPIAEALVAALASDPLSTHLEQTAVASTTDGTSTASVDVNLVGDISGEDVAVHITGTSGELDIDQDVVVIGDDAYARDHGGAWASAPRAALESTITGIFDSVRLVDDPAALTYVGVESVDGRDLHHLTASGTIPYTPASGGTGSYDTFDIFVEEDGTPVKLDATFSAVDASGNNVTGELSLAFSNFGDPIEIAVPEGAPAPE